MQNAPPHLVKNHTVLRILRIVLTVAGVAAAYFCTGRFLLVMGAPPNGAVTTVWLPSGITVAAFLWFGNWAALGSFLGSFALDLHNGTPVPAGLLVGVANAGSEYLCYRLIAGGAEALRRLDKKSVMRLLLAAILASLLSAVVGVTAYLVFGVIPSSLYFSILLTWFGSTAVGIILVAPFLICLLDLSALGGGVQRLEFAAGVLLLACAAFLWQGPLLTHNAHEPVVLGVIVLLLWIAFRFPPAGMPLSVFVFALSAIVGAVVRLQHEPAETAFISIFALQLLLGGLSVLGYLLSSMVAVQRRATEALRLAAKVYETATDGIMITTPDGLILDTNSAFERMSGYSRAETLGTHPRFLQADRHPPEFFESQKEAVERTGEWQGEVWHRRADGTIFPGWLSVSSVRDCKGEVTEVVGILSDITELREAQTRLMATARQAGMAEIATNMLHNVGNVLNSVNVSAQRLQAQVTDSKVSGLARAAALFKEQSQDLPHFLLHDPKGKLLPGYLEKLAATLTAEQQAIVEEIERITRSVDHIKDIVATQQSYAGASSLIEMVQVRALMEDALRLSDEALTRHGVTVIREFSEAPEVALDKARVMMVVVNLISNAKDAVSGVQDRPRLLTLRYGVVERDGRRNVRICVQDNGEGIAQENLTRIFNHGFTTKRNGHGFGLHSCALAATELGGTLSAHSSGPDMGAVFTLEVPVQG